MFPSIGGADAWIRAVRTLTAAGDLDGALATLDAHKPEPTKTAVEPDAVWHGLMGAVRRAESDWRACATHMRLASDLWREAGAPDGMSGSDLYGRHRCVLRAGGGGEERGGSLCLFPFRLLIALSGRHEGERIWVQGRPVPRASKVARLDFALLSPVSATERRGGCV